MSRLRTAKPQAAIDYYSKVLGFPRVITVTPYDLNQFQLT